LNPFELYYLLWTHVTSFEPEKQCLYLSRKASGALFITMICMGVQEISVGVSGFVVWLRLVKWNMFSFSIRELHCWGNFEKEKGRKKKRWSDGGNCYWYYKLSMFVIPPKIPIKGSIYTWYIQIEEAAEWSDWFTCLIYSSLSWFIFCSTSFNGFWATLPNIFHLDPKPRYNPWKVLMIRVMHVTPVV
jgi:hypothetical protein